MRRIREGKGKYGRCLKENSEEQSEGTCDGKQECIRVCRNPYSFGRSVLFSWDGN